MVTAILSIINVSTYQDSITTNSSIGFISSPELGPFCIINLHIACQQKALSIIIMLFLLYHIRRFVYFNILGLYLILSVVCYVCTGCIHIIS